MPKKTLYSRSPHTNSDPSSLHSEPTRYLKPTPCRNPRTAVWRAAPEVPRSALELKVLQRKVLQSECRSRGQFAKPLILNPKL